VICDIQPRRHISNQIIGVAKPKNNHVRIQVSEFRKTDRRRMSTTYVALTLVAARG